MRNMYKSLVGNPKGKTSLGGTIQKWEGNIKVNLVVVGC